MKKLQAWMTRNQVSQRELGERIGCTQGAISRYLGGARSPSAGVLRALNKVTGIGVLDLYYEWMSSQAAHSARRRARRRGRA